MDIVGMMGELGFFDNGPQKGYAWDAGRLDVWVKGGPRMRSRRDLLSLVAALGWRLAENGVPRTWEDVQQLRWVREESDRTVALTIPLPHECCDVWIVGQADALKESERWIARGYRTEVVADLDQLPTAGLIVHPGPRGTAFSGRLGRFPVSSPVVQAWH